MTADWYGGLGGDGNVLELDGVMVAHSCEYT